MKKRGVVFSLFALGFMALLFVPSLRADTIIDEFTGSCNTNTGCTASLSFAPVTGQLLLTDANFGGFVLDVITFNNATSSYTFASDNLDGFDAPADTFGPPLPLANTVSLPEPSNETLELVVYTPTAGQPGYALDSSGRPVTYDVYSDSPGPVRTPEPSTFVLLGLGLVATIGYACYAWRRRSLAQTY